VVSPVSPESLQSSRGDGGGKGAARRETIPALNRGAIGCVRCNSWHTGDVNKNALIAPAVALAVGGVTGLAGAQPYSAWLRMEVSTDEGATWRDGVVDVEPGARTVRVRVRADWTPEGGYALSAARFDVFVRDAADGDVARDFDRPAPFDSFPEMIVATRFGTTIKVDDSRDTQGPGLGTRAIFCFQGSEDGNPDFDPSRPVTVFSYELALDGTLGERVAEARSCGVPPNPATSQSGRRRGAVFGLFRRRSCRCRSAWCRLRAGRCSRERGLCWCAGGNGRRFHRAEEHSPGLGFVPPGGANLGA
jgi:hypothetical protein